ncbi:MAG: hypothetical protein A2138_22195 [Deltaproteobacteria bacterium RBG_16_71_12]|nr:MAG: hypothetical protein A2138_22195 [Deltaproteobacteria bacterium RBG_16_71_12]
MRIPSLPSLSLACLTAGALASPTLAAARAAAVDVPPLRSRFTPEELSAACAKAEQDADGKLAALVAVPDAKRTFKDSFEALDAILGDYGETVARLSFMKDVHPLTPVRDAGAACEERAGKWTVAVSARKDLYLAMKGFLDNAGKGAKLDAEQQRLAEITMRDFKRNGLELSDADRAKLVELRSRLTELQTRFQKNLNEDATKLELKKDELVGLPDDFIAAHEDKARKGVYVVTTKYPDYYPVMENASKEATRKKMETAFMNRGGKENLKLLDEAIKLRSQCAKLLGYQTHADYVAEDRMAKDAATVQAFLGRMKKGLEPALESDRKKMQALKAADTKKKNAVINAWDWRYYLNQIKKAEFAIDDEAVRAYFPADKVLRGMFDVYSTVLGIELKEVAGPDTWFDGVKLFEVRDAGSKALVAKFYLDLYPRDGKYGHAAEFTLSPGHAVPGGYRVPLSALVVNFQPPKDGKPGLLSMGEVDTLFHEFGHVMHESLTTARYMQQSGTRTALDFVEAPSQMLENWAYQPEVLARVSADPKDPTKPIPAELAHKLAAARKFDAGVRYSRQVFLGTFDSAIHAVKPDAAAKLSADAVAKRSWADVMKLPEDKGAHFAGTFGHMMGGYDGGYYGYLWSEVFAADMFTRFAAEGVLNQKVGREYRDRVLARGRTVEPGVLLKDFLGREPNEAAFLKMIGIAAP